MPAKRKAIRKAEVEEYKDKLRDEFASWADERNELEARIKLLTQRMESAAWKFPFLQS